jgi:hypothetical protein
LLQRIIRRKVIGFIVECNGVAHADVFCLQQHSIQNKGTYQEASYFRKMVEKLNAVSFLPRSQSMVRKVELRHALSLSKRLIHALLPRRGAGQAGFSRAPIQISAGGSSVIQLFDLSPSCWRLHRLYGDCAGTL